MKYVSTTKKIWKRLTAGTLLAGAALLSFFAAQAYEQGWFRRPADAAAEAFYSKTVRAGLFLNEVFISGRGRTPLGDIAGAAALARGMPILAIDIAETKRSLESLPWIKEARVSRVLPDRLIIRLTEKTPVAVLQEEKLFTPIDTEGRKIDASPGGLSSLPVLRGENAAENASRLLEILASQPELMREVKGATYVGGRRWDVILTSLTDGLTVMLPEEGALEAWQKLAKLYRQHNILQQKIVRIDMRLKDRFVVKFQDGVQPIPLRLPLFAERAA